MAFSLLSEIHKDSHQWTVCVLVSRMWHYRGGTDDGLIKHTDLVLLDTEGTHMYGQIPAGTANRLKHVLKEGKVFVIKKFLCNPSRPAYRPVESPFMIQFTRYTIVEERPGLEDTYPFCTYSLTSFADIPDPNGPPTRFIDVIGKISMVSDVLPIQSMLQSSASNTRTIMLTDLLGNEVRLVLWGDRAVEFDAETVRAMGEKEPVIAIFVGTLPKSHRGVRGLSGSSACRWYIDEDIPDVNSFRESLGKQFTPLAAYVPTGSDSLTSRVYQNPVDKTVEQLADLDPFVDMAKNFLCTVTVNRLGSYQRWWFSSCSTCHKSARLEGYQFKCSGEGCLSIKAALTYCVSVFASDDTGEAEFVLFDKVAAGAIGKPLMTLMRQRYPGHTRVEDIARVARLDTVIPPEITQLVGQKHKVLVCISKKWKSNNSWNSNNSEDLSFQINRIEETYKPELPALVFGVTSVSGGASSSTIGLGMQLPLLGPITSPVQQLPPMVGSTPNQDFRPGYGSPVGQGCGTPVPRISSATPAKESAAPKRGARRSLYMGSSSDNKEGTKENAIADEENPDASMQTRLGDVAGTIDGKEEEVVIPKTKRSSKKQKQQ